MPNGIVSTWNLDTFEGYGGWVKDDFMFINLGSGELRGLVCRADHSLGHCINLESGHLRGHINVRMSTGGIVSTWNLDILKDRRQLGLIDAQFHQPWI